MLNSLKIWENGFHCYTFPNATSIKENPNYIFATVILFIKADHPFETAAPETCNLSFLSTTQPNTL